MVCNDALDLAQIAALAPERIMISPGLARPTTPACRCSCCAPWARASRCSACAWATRPWARPTAGAWWCARDHARQDLADLPHRRRRLRRPAQSLPATRYHSLVVGAPACPIAWRSPPGRSTPTAAWTRSWDCATAACRCRACSSIRVHPHPARPPTAAQFPARLSAALWLWAAAAAARADLAAGDLAETCRRLVHEAPARTVAACEQARMARGGRRAGRGNAVPPQRCRTGRRRLRRGRGLARPCGGIAAGRLEATVPARAAPRHPGIPARTLRRSADALPRARGLAEQHADATGLGQSDNDIGNAPCVASATTAGRCSPISPASTPSAAAATPLGPVLNNIGDLYRDLDEPDNAARYYAGPWTHTGVPAMCWMPPTRWRPSACWS